MRVEISTILFLLPWLVNCQPLAAVSNDKRARRGLIEVFSTNPRIAKVFDSRNSGKTLIQKFLGDDAETYENSRYVFSSSSNTDDDFKETFSINDDEVALDCLNVVRPTLNINRPIISSHFYQNKPQIPAPVINKKPHQNLNYDSLVLNEIRPSFDPNAVIPVIPAFNIQNPPHQVPQVPHPSVPHSDINKPPHVSYPDIPDTDINRPSSPIIPVYNIHKNPSSIDELLKDVSKEKEHYENSGHMIEIPKLYYHPVKPVHEDVVDRSLMITKNKTETSETAENLRKDEHFRIQLTQIFPPPTDKVQTGKTEQIQKVTTFKNFDELLNNTILELNKTLRPQPNSLSYSKVSKNDRPVTYLSDPDTKNVPAPIDEQPNLLLVDDWLSMAKKLYEVLGSDEKRQLYEANKAIVTKANEKLDTSDDVDLRLLKDQFLVAERTKNNESGKNKEKQSETKNKEIVNNKEIKIVTKNNQEQVKDKSDTSTKTVTKYTEEENNSKNKNVHIVNNVSPLPNSFDDISKFQITNKNVNKINDNTEPLEYIFIKNTTTTETNPDGYVIRKNFTKTTVTTNDNLSPDFVNEIKKIPDSTIETVIKTVNNGKDSTITKTVKNNNDLGSSDSSSVNIITKNNKLIDKTDNLDSLTHQEDPWVLINEINLGDDSGSHVVKNNDVKNENPISFDKILTRTGSKNDNNKSPVDVSNGVYHKTVVHTTHNKSNHAEASSTISNRKTHNTKNSDSFLESLFGLTPKASKTAVVKKPASPTTGNIFANFFSSFLQSVLQNTMKAASRRS